MEQEQVSRLIEENLKTIYAYALSRISHKEDAEDLAGDIVLAILQSAPRLRDDHAFFGYIWAIAANTYKKFLRQRHKLAYTELDETVQDEGADIAEEIERLQERNRLRRELSLLSREHRECTVSFYIDGISCADTAERLGISLDMVKYYLFKTRKLLKEGIGMERIFGEKSYKPSYFEFNTIFSGKFNREYQNLFNRKLPGNILVSAYYTPMTVRQLAIELGVASVYLEDELELLVKYGLLTKLPQGKYQTRLVIFTEAYTEEWIRTVERENMPKLAEILHNVRNKLPEIRKLGFHGSNCDDDHLIWAFLFVLMREGYRVFEEKHPRSERKNRLYDGATGTCYGVDYDKTDDEYRTAGFAGFSKINEEYFAIFANFNILPPENHYTGKEDISASPTLVGNQKSTIEAILSDEINALGDLYGTLSACAVKIMRAHAPEAVGDIVEDVIEQTLFFRSVGLIGAMAVHSGELSLPTERTVKPMLICSMA